jgi:hypothetical protein
MVSYAVGYSVTKGHDSGWVVMASDLVGVPGLEPGTSSLSVQGRPEIRSRDLAMVGGGDEPDELVA